MSAQEGGKNILGRDGMLYCITKVEQLKWQKSSRIRLKFEKGSLERQVIARQISWTTTCMSDLCAFIEASN